MILKGVHISTMFYLIALHTCLGLTLVISFWLKYNLYIGGFINQFKDLPNGF